MSNVISKQPKKESYDNTSKKSFRCVSGTREISIAVSERMASEGVMDMLYCMYPGESWEVFNSQNEKLHVKYSQNESR